MTKPQRIVRRTSFAVKPAQDSGSRVRRDVSLRSAPPAPRPPPGSSPPGSPGRSAAPPACCRTPCTPPQVLARLPVRHEVPRRLLLVHRHRRQHRRPVQHRVRRVHHPVDVRLPRRRHPVLPRRQVRKAPRRRAAAIAGLLLGEVPLGPRPHVVLQVPVALYPAVPSSITHACGGGSWRNATLKRSSTGSPAMSSRS
jgi:hypothetical protein